MRDKNIPKSWLIFSDRFEWREWLTANHLKESGVWLQTRKIKSKRPWNLHKTVRAFLENVSIKKLDEKCEPWTRESFDSI